MYGFLGETVFYGQAIQQLDKPRHPGAIGVGWHEERTRQLAVALDCGQMVCEVVTQYCATIALQGIEICQRTDEVVMNRFAIG